MGPRQYRNRTFCTSAFNQVLCHLCKSQDSAGRNRYSYLGGRNLAHGLKRGNSLGTSRRFIQFSPAESWDSQGKRRQRRPVVVLGKHCHFEKNNDRKTSEAAPFKIYQEIQQPGHSETLLQIGLKCGDFVLVLRSLKPLRKPFLVPKLTSI
jgi:hypothetical protein